ncbi:MAG: hypothetical protein SFV81_06425 [Pirellulaceae bacterium]|nr:hypothetical protein [Pirellulaceae bacterium]
MFRISMLICASLCNASAVLADSPSADLRVWTHTDGRTLTAEFIGLAQSDQAILRTKDGKQHLVKLSILCPADQVFLRLILPVPLVPLG